MSRIADIYDLIEAADRPEVFISLRERAAVERDYECSLAGGGALAGVVLAVKDNVDVAGLPTTAACPGFEYVPERDAAAVAALRSAGAVVIGKTNLDQFATGLVGTRSPYGAVRDSRRPDRISGGSSSGSAVAVALGFADIAIGTDTAGSGRVPAGLQGIVGIKPTLGVVSTAGVVPACASYDCVTVLARDLDLANRAMGSMAGTDNWGTAVRFAAPDSPVVAVPAQLPGLDERWQDAFEAAIERAETAGVRVKRIDISDFLAAAKLLYEGALVAERYEAVGEFISTASESAALDPTVAAIIGAADRFTAVELLADRRRVEQLRVRALATLGDADALLVPTAPMHPTLDQVAADPVGVNAAMGTYTNFCNLFDMCAVAVPAGTVDDTDGTAAQFGVTVICRHHDDAIALDIAGRIGTLPAGEGPFWPELAGAAATEVFVVGAHLRGQPLMHQLTDRGARWNGEAATAASYRLVALDTQPEKPGLVRDTAAGTSIRGELWTLSPAALGDFLTALPTPMTLGAVELEGGRWTVGFACDHEAVATAEPLSVTHWLER
ncbi:allophanate hydrolase [Gordonia rubripertincta]|uniref:Allophanate hydrolase n=1 Tax=Gordonia rubripertincta TaxID=36822 RepID=A0ABT4MSF2_GORRU|nr:allophanate hydrolase [Gordonia rubripertincta]MCZ4549933.1 allophanate hydrolase [Gordonia rubripertincta]